MMQPPPSTDPNRNAARRESESLVPGSRTSPAPSRFTLDRIIRFMLVAGVVVVSGWLIWYFASLVIFLVVGVVLAYLMRPIVDRLQGFGLGRIPSILATFVLVFGGLILLITELAPFASRQIQEISQQVNFQTAAQITAVDPDGPAEDAGLSADDVIVAIEGQPYDGFSRLQSILNTKSPGDSVQVVLDVEGGGRTSRWIVISPAGRLQNGRPVISDASSERYVASLGLTAQEITLSNVVAAVERRIRAVLPVERGEIVNAIGQGLSQMFGDEQISSIAGSIVAVFTDIFYAVLVIPFVAFFFLKDGSQIRRGLLRLVPNRYFELTLAMIAKIETIIGRYFLALFVQILAVAVVASTLLYIVGLHYAIAVGIFTGLANTIPYFGPLMGFLAGTLVGVVQTGDFRLVPGVVVAMLLTQATDNTIFQPYIFSRAAQAHPLLILFAVLIGAQIAGILGMLVAIPLMTIVRVAVQQLLWSLRNYRILQSS